jgi:MFS family permease
VQKFDETEDLFSLREVASLRSYVNVAATTGRSLGGPIGGFLTDTIGWRWYGHAFKSFVLIAHIARSFLGQAPLIGLSAIIAGFVVPRGHKLTSDVESKGKKFRRIDFAGAFLLAATVASFILAVELGGQKLPWTSPTVLGLLGAGTACGALFVTAEKYWALEPIFPLELLWHKDVLCAYLVLMLQTAAQFGVSLYHPGCLLEASNAYVPL